MHIVESLYSLGSMFVGRQNFPGSRERNFVGKCNRDNLKKYKKNDCLHVHVDVNSWERVTLESHEH